MPDLPGAVAAILAVTAVPPDGLLPVAYDEDGNAVTGERADVVAARQAAAARPAILRELAAELEAREVPAEGKIWLIDARWLRNRADEIEAGAGGQQPEGGQ